jgi:uncharacterized repeat protein (TIGR02543 family)
MRQVFIFIAALCLTACLNSQQGYTVTYDPNAITYNGTVPVDPNRYRAGSTVTIPAPPPLGRYPQNDLEIPPQHGIPGCVFDGWNTKADGSGTNYYPGATFLMPRHKVTLYVNWKSLARPGVLY